MNVQGEKIKQLIEVYGNRKEHPKKSHLPMFCEENELNYIQWNAYCRGSQQLGMKIISILINIFPDLNLNWLLKDDYNMFVEKEESTTLVLKEPEPKYSKKIDQEDIYNKLEDILNELKKTTIKDI